MILQLRSYPPPQNNISYQNISNKYYHNIPYHLVCALAPQFGANVAFAGQTQNQGNQACQDRLGGGGVKKRKFMKQKKSHS